VITFKSKLKVVFYFCFRGLNELKSASTHGKFWILHIIFKFYVLDTKILLASLSFYKTALHFSSDMLEFVDHPDMPAAGKASYYSPYILEGWLIAGRHRTFLPFTSYVVNLE
jgi:hypothetical protein